MEHIRGTFRYAVFLSFRGVDTRNNFTSHLHEALKRHNFEVFHDTSLPRGLGIGPQLLEAINESKIYVVVFSARYADSKWCLGELSEMMQCARMNDQRTVLPVFLDIKQSEVATENGPFEELVTNKEKKFDQETVQKWRKALKEAGKLTGLHLQDDANGDEHELVNQIVEKLRKMLHDQRGVNAADLHHLVGIDSRVQEVIALLNAGSSDDDDVRVVVISGPVGIGKTTIAKATFGRLAIHFKAQYSCFLSDVKTTFGEPNGRLTLQKKLISNLVQDDESRINLQNYHEGIRRIEKMIRNQKLLLVVDDVDNEEQLRILGDLSRASLGSGSRIIVTTTDESRIVDQLRPDAIYKPRFLDELESLKVLCWNAFGEYRVKEGYGDVSSEAVRWGAGIPGVVKDLGVYMGGFESVEEWRCAIRYVKKNPSCITNR